ncbi:hypothetical protein [Flaviaesturariibacter aridisoli]|uniref:Uncharacterized protein n=1 Tax=Flaviaesturariibacter aridisoli TaxID=2545761 RepID=A0A4R4DZS4_9BACT|nr:hypothetical protein [Flaviaesturariibacter aridisoli]TCZ72249.1 hypothetical protein E0486_09160 [Flaviaesturariibacter aridisoli]
MPRLFLLLPLFLIAACSSNDSQPRQSVAATAAAATSPTDTSWLPAFRAFRDAVYRHDKTAARAFVPLPMDTVENDVWYVAELEKATATGINGARPFTAAHFDRYFDQLFAPGFIKTLLKVKSDTLYRSGRYETPFITEGDTRYRMYTRVEDNILLLNLYSESVTEAEEEVTTEFSVLYYFDIQGNRLQLRRIRVAG